jgi:hypothetical protein
MFVGPEINMKALTRRTLTVAQKALGCCRLQMYAESACCRLQMCVHAVTCLTIFVGIVQATVSFGSATDPNASSVQVRPCYATSR